MAKDKSAEKRENGFSVYPDDETLKRLDKMAGLQDRKRSPMAVIAMKRGLDMLEREAKAK